MSEMISNNNTQLLSEIRECAERFAGSLPDCIQAAGLTFKSKLPFKALSIRELMLHRMAALSIATVELFEKKQVIPAVILTRSIVETLAVLFTFHERLDRFLKDNTKDIAILDDFLMRCLVGARNIPEMPTPTNILTLIDCVEKTIPGFRSVYDALCEYAHPNWAGTFGAFGQVDKEKLELKLGPTKRTPAYSTGLNALSVSMMIFEHYYNASAELVRQLNDYFDKTSDDT